MTDCCLSYPPSLPRTRALFLVVYSIKGTCYNITVSGLSDIDCTVSQFPHRFYRSDRL